MTRRIKKAIIMIKKGMVPAKMSSIVTSSTSTDFIAKTTMPKGRVISPISTATTATIPNQIMLKPRSLTDGIIKGMQTSRMDVESKMVPKTIKTRTNIRITTIGGRDREAINSPLLATRPLKVNIWEYIWAVMSRRKILAVT